MRLLSNVEFGLLEAAADGSLHRDNLHAHKWVNADDACYSQGLVEGLCRQRMLSAQTRTVSHGARSFVVLTPRGRATLLRFRNRKSGQEEKGPDAKFSMQRREETLK